ncbi:MAG TPA: RNA polymerase sigma-70 factor [Candidatus Butyricimonas faecavium]|nr:RNA polymerase sigma-70 factor [Candidatus Butyricimonas faecavium]
MTSKVPINQDRLINGDEKEFKSLFDLLYVGMVQQATFYTNDFAVAEDVVQEIFVRLWEKRDELKEVQNLQGYLLLSVKNRCLNYLEHQQVVDKYKQYCLLQEVQDNNEDSEQFIENVGRLLEKLPEKRRRVLEMSVLEAKSYAEIAELLGISLNTVKDHVKKAYAFLREELRQNISLPVLFFVLYYMRKNILE